MFGELLLNVTATAATTGAGATVLLLGSGVTVVGFAVGPPIIGALGALVGFPIAVGGGFFVTKGLHTQAKLIRDYFYPSKFQVEEIVHSQHVQVANFIDYNDYCFPQEYEKFLNNSICFSEENPITNINTNTFQLTPEIFKEIVFFCKDNAHVFLITGLAFVIGYGLWRYFSLKTEQPDPQGPGTGEGLSILVDPTPPLPTSPIPVLPDVLTPETAHPPANPLDNTVETVEDTINIAVERVRDALPDELILDMLIQQIINQNEQHSFLREMFQFFRDFLGEISRQIAEILIHLAPAAHNAVIALSLIPNIPS